MEEKKFNNALDKAENLSADNNNDNTSERGTANNYSGATKNSGSVTKIEDKPTPAVRRVSQTNTKSGAKSHSATNGKSSAKSTVKKVSANKNTKSKNGAVNISNTKNDKGAKKAAKAELKKDKKAAKAEKMARKERMLAEKQKKEEKKAADRIKKAEAKAASKEKNKRDKVAKIQAEKRKKESIKQLKIRKKEERLARRDMLRHESKEDRAERKLKEKENRKAAAMKKRQQVAQIKAEKAKAKEQSRRQKAEEKRMRKTEKRQRGLGGWITAVATLGVVSLVLATMLVWNMYMPGNSTSMLSTAYSKNFYDLVDYVDNLDVNLAKLNVSGDNDSRQKLLTDVIVQANLASDSLSSLPIREDARGGTIKFINQVGDFSKYLNNKLIDGKTFSERDISTLNQFKEVNGKIREQLDGLVDEMGYDFDFTTLIGEEENNIILEKFNELEYNSVEYPKMIYDGPFADEDENSACNKKTGEKITEEQAVALVESQFADYGITKCSLKGTAEGKCFNVYNIDAEIKDNNVFVQVSEFGDIVLFDVFKESDSANSGRDECIEKATAFLDKLGYKSIKPVWTTESGNSVYINFAPFNKDGVILYSDLIKMSVCQSDGTVCDMDSKMYAENHKEREIPEPKLRVEEAEKKISSAIDIKTSRLAYIPLESKEERLAYEFYGEASDGEYYIYIDAVTGKELKIFKVIDNGNGTLLL